MYECFHCGERAVIWDADFDFDDYGYDGEGIVHACHCTNCGAEISIPTTKEIEADGFITPPSALEHKTERTAKPVSECVYPKCEECDKYHGHYCTVPMVVSKQIYRETMERIGKIEKTLAELENLVYDKIMGAK